MSRVSIFGAIILGLVAQAQADVKLFDSTTQVYTPKLLSFRSSGRELFYVDANDFIHVQPGVTAADVARAWVDTVHEQPKVWARPPFDNYIIGTSTYRWAPFSCVFLQATLEVVGLRPFTKCFDASEPTTGRVMR